MGHLAEAADTPERDALYAADRDRQGYVAGYTKVFAHRPRVYRAWQELNGAVKASMDPVRYEVATVAAAQQVRSAYCSLAHGAVLADLTDTAQAVEVAAGTDPDPERRAIATLARKVVAAPDAITEGDLGELRSLGFTDDDLLDVVLAAAARGFFSSVLGATGAEPDAALTRIDGALRAALLDFRT